MTVNTTSNKIRYVGNGATTTWPFSFIIPDINNLQLYYTDLTGATILVSLSAYSVVGIDSPSGGTVTYPLTGPAIAAGTILEIMRVVPYTQVIDLVNQDGFYPEVVENGLDSLEMQIQQLIEVQGRNLTVGITDTSPGTLPAAAQRANQLLGFDGSGNAIAAQPSSALVSVAMQPVVNAATIAAAIALMGLSPFPAGLECDYAGLIAPTGWYLEYGQAVTRAGDTALFAAIAPTIGCVITSGSANVTGIADTGGFYIGMPIESAGFPAGTVVSSALTGNAFTANNPAGSNATTFQAFPFGNGDGSTTFNLPDGRGYGYAGRDNMGGAAAGRLTSPIINGAGLSIAGGAQTHLLTTAEMPAHNHTANVTDPGHTHTVAVISSPANIFNSGGGENRTTTGPTTSSSNTTGITVATVNTGGGGAHSVTQPTSIRNKIIKR